MSRRLSRWILVCVLALPLVLFGCQASPTATPTSTFTPTPTRPPLTPTSAQDLEEFRIDLAKHLTDIGAVMYGTYSCGYCKRQKRLFGDAFQYVTYVECAYGGENAQPKLCEAKGIRSVPTWEINGKLYLGVKSLEKLAELSGYTK